MLGTKDVLPSIETAIIGCDFNKNDKLQDYLRAKITLNKAGEIIAIPFDQQDSSMLANYAKAQCLVLRLPFADAISKGESVKIIRLDCIF